MAMFLLMAGTEQFRIHSTGVVGGVGQHVDAAVDGHLTPARLEGWAKTSLPLRWRLGDGCPGNIQRHGQHVSARDP